MFLERQEGASDPMHRQQLPSALGELSAEPELHSSGSPVDATVVCITAVVCRRRRLETAISICETLGRSPNLFPAWMRLHFVFAMNERAKMQN